MNRFRCVGEDASMPGTNRLCIKKAVADTIYRFGARRSGLVKEDSVRVLLYHSVTDDLVRSDVAQMTTPKGLFAEQMGYLRDKGYNVLSCEHMVDVIKRKIPIPPKAVCITFDDGYRDNLLNAYPILDEHDYSATIFLTAGLIGEDERYLSWDEIRTMERSGIFSFGSHTYTHKKLSGLDAASLDPEIIGSKRRIEEELGKGVALFAYPFGSYDSFDKRSIDLIKSSGYAAAFANIAGANDYDTDLFALRRMRMSWFDDPDQFNKQLLGCYDWYGLWQRILRTQQ